MTPLLTIKWKLLCRSRNTRGRINQWQFLIPGLVIGWLFRFCSWLRQHSFHWIISDGVVNGIAGNGNVVILPTPILSSLWLRLRLRFYSDYDSTPTPSLVKTSLYWTQLKNLKHQDILRHELRLNIYYSGKLLRWVSALSNCMLFNKVLFAAILDCFQHLRWCSYLAYLTSRKRAWILFHM